MEDAQTFCDALLTGAKAHEKVGELTKKATDEGVEMKEIIVKGLFAGMALVGDKFKEGEVYVPELLIAFRALERVIGTTELDAVAKIIVGTVKGDLHDIGKNLVAMMFKASGFKVIDLKIDVSPERYVESARAEGAELIGLSALLTTTMPQMKAVVEAVKAAGLDTKVLIGGAPVTQAYCDEIGADGYAPDAASAVDVGKRILGL